MRQPLWQRMTSPFAGAASGWPRSTPNRFYDFTTVRLAVRLGQHGSRRIVWPANEFRVAHCPDANMDLVFLIGVEPQLRWRTFCEQVVMAAEDLEVERVITLGGLLSEVPHTRPVQVYGSSEDARMRDELDLEQSTYEGPTGIVGVLAAACHDAGFPTASFWAAVPSYLPTAPSPKAAMALQNRFCAALGLPVYLSDLVEATESYEAKLAEMVSTDDDMAEFVSRLEQLWDRRKQREARERVWSDDPRKLVTEVERFLRDSA